LVPRSFTGNDFFQFIKQGCADNDANDKIAGFLTLRPIDVLGELINNICLH
jgi:hypothetical protein